MHTKQENKKTTKIDEIFLFHLDTEGLYDFTFTITIYKAKN